MKSIAENMLTIQQLAQKGGTLTSAQQATVRKLRCEVPAPVLAHFDRMLKGRGAGVALVRHGVCCGCHMRLPTSTYATLKISSDVFLCDYCSCYLLLDPEETAAESALPADEPVIARKASKKRVVAMA